MPDFVKLYGMSELALHMVFIKRMRRHHYFPKQDEYFPVFESDGCIARGYNFKARPKRVDIIKIDRVDELKFAVNTIEDAWQTLIKDIRDTLC